MQFQLNILVSVNRFLSIMFPKYYYNVSAAGCI